MYLLTCSWWLCVKDLVILPLLLSICLNPQQQVSASKARLLLCLHIQSEKINPGRLSALLLHHNAAE